MSCDTFNSTQQCDSLEVASQVAGGLSVFGCVVVICWTLLLRNQRFFIHRLLLVVCLATLLDTVPYFFVDDWLQDNSRMCQFQGFWIQFAEWSVMCWMSCLTYNLFATIVHQRDTKPLERSYHLVCWGVSLLAAIIPLAAGVFAKSGSWCWVQEEPKWMRFLAFYAFKFAYISITVLIYLYIFWFLRRRARQWQGTYRPEYEEEKRLIRLQAHPLRFYPIVYVLLSLVGEANRIQNAIQPDQPDYMLYLLHALTAPLLGFVIAIVYVTSGDLSSRCQCRGGRYGTAVREYSTEDNVAIVNEEDSDEEMLESSSPNDVVDY